MYICIYMYVYIYARIYLCMYIDFILQCSHCNLYCYVLLVYIYIYSCIYDCMCILTFASIAPVCHPTCSAKKSATFVKLGISSLQVAHERSHELKCWNCTGRAPLVGFPGQLIRGRPEEQNKWSETSAFKYPTAGNCGGPKLGNLWVFCVQVPLKMLKMLKYWGWKPTPDIGIAINFSVSLGWIFRVNQTSDVFYLIPSITLLKDLAMTAIVTSGPKSKLQ